jgi:uncharacterized protein YjbI with pentapeptide repeats
VTVRQDLGLRADCANCFGLCCVGPEFVASSDFAITKAAGTACPNLGPDFGCGIHEQLRPRGFAGCTVYDCFGAGQKVAQVTFAGQDWRQHPELARPMFASLTVMRQLHELLWYLTEALSLPAAAILHPELRSARDETQRLTTGSHRELLAVEVDRHRAAVNPLLVRTGELVRSSLTGRPGPDHRGGDLIGRDLRGADLRGASLRGALLVGANLSHADLRTADLTGADLRGADLAGADLTGCVFLVQSQLRSAQGDAATRIPSGVDRPDHWSQVSPTRNRARR